MSHGVVTDSFSVSSHDAVTGAQKKMKNNNNDCEVALRHGGSSNLDEEWAALDDLAPSKRPSNKDAIPQHDGSDVDVRRGDCEAALQHDDVSSLNLDFGMLAMGGRLVLKPLLLQRMATMTTSCV